MTTHDEREQALLALIGAGDVAAFVDRARDLHPSDLSDVLAKLDEETRLSLVKTLPPELVSDALAEMEPEEHPEEVLAALPPEEAAHIVDELEDDDAADLLGELPPEQATSILRGVDDREDIERLLEYDEETAGGIMTTGVVSVLETLDASGAIDEIRRQSEDVEEFYQVYCIDQHERLVGVLPLQLLVRVPSARPVHSIMEQTQAVVTADTDQEDVARVMARYNVASIPVVDEQGRLIGRVTFDDVIDVVEAEQTEDLLRFGGTSADEELGGDWLQAVRSRLPWLSLNLITASMSMFVVRFFLGTLERSLLLAALAPVVVGMGGNAGTQALAVTVRRLALGQIGKDRARAMIGKEFLAGLINGAAIGLLVGTIAALLGDGWRFGSIVMLAMWGNLLLGVISGATIPLMLERLGFDPAVASSGFVTAITDVCGYFLLLGLATVLLLS